MVSVAEAERIIQAQVKDYGTELVPFESALGRVLAEDIRADRDLPPCDRATMDGVAISYKAFENGAKVRFDNFSKVVKSGTGSGIHSFRIKGTIAAGDEPIELEAEDECVEIMTGAPVPVSADTVIRYEDVGIQNGIATVTTENIKSGQNIHRKGKDKKRDDIVAAAPQFIDPALISMAASVGKNNLLVKKLPKVVIISTGDELVAVDAQPTPYQVRQSNNYTIKAALEQYCLQPDMLHLPDNAAITKEEIKKCLEDYDVLILSGGISMGKFDYVPLALEELSVTKLFHKVQQRPGKPFWFGSYKDSVLAFAFPGNPVSTFMCLHRYFIPWLTASLMRVQIPNSKFQIPKLYAVLDADVAFAAPLQYFVQVRLHLSAQGQLRATPEEGNGSGDFANLLDTNAFMELPLEQSNFRKGEVYRIWPFKQII